MRTFALLSVARALLLASFGCTGSGTTPQRKLWVWAGWEPLAWIALATVALLLSLGYMASVLTANDQLKAWVKKEVGQLFFSLLIVIFTVALVGSVDYWLKGLSSISISTDPSSPNNSWGAYVNNAVCCDGSSGPCMGLVRKRPCHIELASDYLQLLYETARLNAESILSNYWFYGFLSNTSMTVFFIADDRNPIASFSLFAGMSMLANLYSILFDLVMKTMMVIRAQQIFFDFLWYAIFPVFLSVGLVLRILYFTRKLGGLLIALALSAYIVLPMIYVVSDAILFSMMGGWTAEVGWQAFGNEFNANSATGGSALPFTDPSNPVNFGSSAGAKGVFDPSKAANIDLCNEDLQGRGQMNSLVDSFAANWNLFEHANWFGQASSYIENGLFEYNGPIGTLATLMAFSLFVPFLSLMTMLASVKVLSPLIGGDVEISVLSRLI